MSDISALMVNSQSFPKLLTETLPTGGRRWIDIGDSPLARASTYKAIELGWFDSVVVQFPGSRRKRRFIDALSINRYFETLMAEQKASKGNKASQEVADETTT